MPAYAYLRKSVVQRDDPHNSAEAQEAAVRALADLEGDRDLVILSDWDKSGKLGRDKRPGYDALWRAIESGQCTAVYSYSMSRLARRMSELLRLFETCAERKIPVRLRADKIDTGSASGRMVAGVLASVSVFEADVAGERMLAAMAAKAARRVAWLAENPGKKAKDAPRGLRKATVLLYGEKDGEDVDAVMRAWQQTGSFNGAARLLNDWKVPCRNSKRGWWSSSVGTVVRRLDPSIPITTKGAKARSDFALARLLRCGVCHTPLSGHNGPPLRYTCRMGELVPHGRVSITESHVLPAIIDEVGHWIRTPIFVVPRDREDPKVVEKKAALEAAHDVGALSEVAYRTALADLEPTVAVEEDEAWLDDLDPHNLPTVWSVGTPAQKNQALRRVFDRIELDPETFRPVAYEPRPGWRRRD
jgi:DNA invertase Pin-like site-specific DNA recombinase